MDQEIYNKLPIDFNDVNPLTSKGGEIRVMISPKTVRSTRLILGHVVLKPGETLVEHVHDYGEETFFVTKGSGTIYVDGVEKKIQKNSAMIVPQNSTHKLINDHGSEDLELIFATAPLAPTAKKGDRVVNENK